MVRAGILLSGLGYGDGSDLGETVLAALFLSQAEADVLFVAPDIPYRVVLNHLAARPMDEERNVLVESARVSHQQVQSVDKVEPAQLDVLIVPGGLGVLKNLCDFNSSKENCRVNEGVRHLLVGMVRRKKPVGVVSQGAVLLARVLQQRQGVTPTLTVGNDAELAGHIQNLGGIHVLTRADEALVDEQNRLVSTAGALSGGRLAVVAQGIQNLITGTLELIHRGEHDTRRSS